MKPVSTIQEILLMTATTFSKKQFCELNSPEGHGNVNAVEQLKEACWNGLVNELLPEIMPKLPGSEKIFLWQVDAMTSCLRMSLGTCIPVLEKMYTLDPHIFLSSGEKMN